MAARELVNFVNLPPAPVVCLVTKIKKGAAKDRKFNLQNKTNSTAHTSIHIVHMFTAVVVVEKAESYVKNGQNCQNQPRGREYFELLLTYMRSRRHFAQGEKKGSYLRCWERVNCGELPKRKFTEIQSLNIENGFWERIERMGGVMSQDWIRQIEDDNRQLRDEAAKTGLALKEAVGLVAELRETAAAMLAHMNDDGDDWSAAEAFKNAMEKAGRFVSLQNAGKLTQLGELEERLGVANQALEYVDEEIRPLINRLAFLYKDTVAVRLANELAPLLNRWRSYLRREVEHV